MRPTSLAIVPCALLLLMTGATPVAQAQMSRVSATSAAPSSVVGGFTCPNGGPLLISQQPNQSNGLFSDADCAACGTGQQSVADDFVLAAPASVGQIVLWGGYFPGNMIPGAPDSFTVIFHQDAALLPGANIDTQTLAPTSATTTGVTLFGVSEVLYVVDLTPVALPAGTFWVEIFTNTAGNTDQFFWEVGNLDAVNGRLNNAFATVVPGAAWNAGNPVADGAFALCGAGAVEADLSIAKSAMVAGDTITYTIDVVNNGPDDASNVVVTDALPAAVTYVSDTCGGANVPPWTWNVGALANGASVSCDIVVSFDSGTPGTISNTANVTADQTDPAPGDESSTADVTVGVPTLEIPTVGTIGFVALTLLLAAAGLLAGKRRGAFRRG